MSGPRPAAGSRSPRRRAGAEAHGSPMLQDVLSRGLHCSNFPGSPIHRRFEMTRAQQISVMLLWILAAAAVGSGSGLAADHNAELTCNAWYSGRLVGYIYWATAPENDIKVCVKDHGANLKDVYGLAPLHHALSNPNVRDERIKLLIDIGADVNLRGYRNVTPLIMAAAYASSPKIIQRLLRSGASPKHVDDWGENALGAVRQNPNMSRQNKRIIESFLHKSWIGEASEQ